MSSIWGGWSVESSVEFSVDSMLRQPTNIVVIQAIAISLSLNVKTTLN